MVLTLLQVGMVVVGVCVGGISGSGNNSSYYHKLQVSVAFMVKSLYFLFFSAVVNT